MASVSFTVLKDGPLLMFKCYFRKEAKILEQQGKTNGLTISQDQILGEGNYTDLQVQAFMMKKSCPYATKQP